ncbi:AI-2E family transporter [Marinobacter salinisoli]|uniref:AI-2E family transporter n=1 Tax=Marinobacter salinisoli TaxID=2769486 RepID=A0ABX7MR35_9GAMM|nr:AI-2E family transporter [Marinobacter salinisoli]QSP94780.1 AI-2E family transporter [Marinobacter salinisoli]
MEQHGPNNQDSAGNAGPGTPNPPLLDAVNIRSVALLVVASMVSLYFIEWAKAVLLPLVVAILISFTLDPLVSGLRRLKIPRPLGAAIILALLVSIIGFASVPLKNEAITMLDRIPAAFDKFQRKQMNTPDEESIVEKAQKVAKEIEDTASSDAEASQRSPTGVTRVQEVEKPFDIQQYVIESTPAALVLVSQLFSVLFLVYFLLSAGSIYQRKIVKLSGPSIARMRKAARIMADVHRQVRRFLFVTALSGLFVGLVTWLAFLAVDLDQAALWGVLAGIASAIPYLGPFLVLIGSGLAAFVQFGELNMAIIVGGLSLAISSVQGYLLTPWLTSFITSLNAVTIFVGLLFWGWLWGPVGLIVATPILMITKSICDHVANLRGLGEILGK